MSTAALIVALATGLLGFLVARYAVPFIHWRRWVRGAVLWVLPFWLYLAASLVLAALEPEAAEDAVGWVVFIAIFAFWPVWFAWAFGYVLGHIVRIGGLSEPR